MTLKAIEFSINVTNEPFYLIPTTWHLVKKVTPGMNTVEYKYNRGCPQFNTTMFQFSTVSYFHVQLGNECGPINMFKTFFTMGFLFKPCIKYDGFNFSFGDPQYRVDLLYPSYIAEITTPNSKIKFTKVRVDQLTFNKDITSDNASTEISITRPWDITVRN